MSKQKIEACVQDLLSNRYTDGVSVCYGNTHMDKQLYYGNISGDNEIPVSHDTIYDLASVTKMLTTIAVLKLYEEGRVDLDAELGSYTSDYPMVSHLKIYELMNFSKGLQTNGRIDDAGSYEEALQCLKTASVSSDTPIYNDIGMLIVSILINHLLKDEGGFEAYSEALWKEIGLNNTCWWYKLPANERSHLQCYDYEYRLSKSSISTKRTPLGLCHDGKAAILKTCGHAGIYSTPLDMVILARKLLSQQILSNETLTLWASTKYTCKSKETENKKPQYYGIGCYRKNPNRAESEIPAISSDQSLAISGYAGCYYLLDIAKNEYCFIGSNRIYKRLTRTDKKDPIEELQSANDIISNSSKYAYAKDQLVDACIEDLSE